MTKRQLNQNFRDLVSNRQMKRQEIEKGHAKKPLDSSVRTSNLSSTKEKLKQNEEIFENSGKLTLPKVDHKAEVNLPHFEDVSRSSHEVNKEGHLQKYVEQYEKLNNTVDEAPKNQGQAKSGSKLGPSTGDDQSTTHKSVNHSKATELHSVSNHDPLNKLSISRIEN